MATLQEQIEAVKPGESFRYDDSKPGDLTITRSADGQTILEVFGNEFSGEEDTTESWDDYTHPQFGYAAFASMILGSDTPYNVIIIENTDAKEAN